MYVTFWSINRGTLMSFGVIVSQNSTNWFNDDKPFVTIDTEGFVALKDPHFTMSFSKIFGFRQLTMLVPSSSSMLLKFLSADGTLDKISYTCLAYNRKRQDKNQEDSPKDAHEFFILIVSIDSQKTLFKLMITLVFAY